MTIHLLAENSPKSRSAASYKGLTFANVSWNGNFDDFFESRIKVVNGWENSSVASLIFFEES